MHACSICIHDLFTYKYVHIYYAIVLEAIAPRSTFFQVPSLRHEFVLYFRDKCIIFALKKEHKHDTFYVTNNYS